nr:hypothetical protein [Candidatus Sigynarchaeota archaeon]
MIEAHWAGEDAAGNLPKDAEPRTLRSAWQARIVPGQEVKARAVAMLYQLDLFRSGNMNSRAQFQASVVFRGQSIDVTATPDDFCAVAGKQWSDVGTDPADFRRMEEWFLRIGVPTAEDNEGYYGWLGGKLWGHLDPEKHVWVKAAVRDPGAAPFAMVTDPQSGESALDVSTRWTDIPDTVELRADGQRIESWDQLRGGKAITITVVENRRMLFSFPSMNDVNMYLMSAGFLPSNSEFKRISGMRDFANLFNRFVSKLANTKQDLFDYPDAFWRTKQTMSLPGSFTGVAQSLRSIKGIGKYSITLASCDLSTGEWTAEIKHLRDATRPPIIVSWDGEGSFSVIVPTGSAYCNQGSWRISLW